MRPHTVPHNNSTRRYGADSREMFRDEKASVCTWLDGKRIRGCGAASVASVVPLLTPGRVAPNLRPDAALALPLRGCDGPHLGVVFCCEGGGHCLSP